MILLAAIVGGVILGVGAVAAFWDSLVTWVKQQFQEVKNIIEGTIYGIKIFAQKMGKAFKEISKYYSRNQHGQWEETTKTRKISADEVPPDILKSVGSHSETDITKKLELNLS